MPVTKIKRPNGSWGYRWGSSGRVYATRAAAAKQGKAARAAGYKPKPKPKK